MEYAKYSNNNSTHCPTLYHFDSKTIIKCTAVQVASKIANYMFSGTNEKNIKNITSFFNIINALF